MVLAVGLALALAACGGGDDTPADTVQMRPVLGQSSACKPLRANPDEDKPSALEARGKCVGLAPSVLTVDEALVRRADGRIQVKLSGKDVETLAQVSKDFIGDEIALVVGGRIVNIPVFRQVVDNGEFEILGLNEADSDLVEKTLAD